MFKLIKKIQFNLFGKWKCHHLTEEQKNILRTLMDNDNKSMQFNPYDPNIKSLVRWGLLSKSNDEHNLPKREQGTELD